MKGKMKKKKTHEPEPRALVGKLLYFYQKFGGGGVRMSSMIRIRLERRQSGC